MSLSFRQWREMAIMEYEVVSKNYNRKVYESAVIDKDTQNVELVQLTLREVLDKCEGTNYEYNIKRAIMKCVYTNDRLEKEVKEVMDEFYEAGITMNTQVVLCKNINDGEHLKKTIRRMERLYPQVHSVSIVPFGMTRYRDGLEKVESYTKEECRRIIEQVNRWTEDFVKEHNGERLVYLSDEFYMRAQVPLPPAEYYCDYAQLENGVGLVRNFMDNFLEEVEYAEEPYKQVKADMAVGEAMYPIMCQVFQKANEKLKGALDIKVHKIVNNFFGGNVWVTGLITAQDLIRQVQGKLTSDTLLLCADMLDSENEFFLDDKTPEDVEKALGVKLSFYPNDGVKMAQELLGTEY